MSELEIDGRWWLPGRPERCRGLLEFNTIGGGDLHLEELLPGADPTTPRGDIPVIHGQGFNFQRYSLLGGWDQARHFGNPRPQTVHASVLVEGAHALDADPSYDRLVLRFEPLSEFVALSGLSVTEGSSGQVAVEWEPVPEPGLTYDGVTITFRGQSRFGWGTDFEYSLAHQTSIELKRDEPAPLSSWTRDFVDPLLALVAFGIGKWPQAPGVFAGEDPLRQRLRWSVRATAGPRHQYAPVLFTLDDLPADGVDRWLRLARDRSDAYNLFVEAELLNPSVLPESQILDTARFVEVFHRRSARGGRDPTAIHRARIQEIVESAPQQHVEWLKEALAFSNEKRLRDRIEALLDDLEPALQPALGDPAQFARLATNTRNFNTHFSLGLRRRSATGEAAVRLADRMSMLVRACVLRELGVDLSDIATMLARDRRHGWLAAAATTGK